jgi:hypothetical protein
MIQGYKRKALIMADEMRAYDPTMRERMASALQGGMEGMGVGRQKARRHAQTIVGGESSNLPIGMGIADFVPFVGTSMALEEGARGLGEAAESAKRGDYIDATAETAGAAAGLIPGGYSTYKTGKNMLKKLKTLDLPKLKPIETESVPKKKQQSLKEWAMAGGGVPTSHAGRTEVWHKKAQKYAKGGAVYAKGGAVKKAVKDAVEGVVDGLKPMVDRINMHFKDVTKRVPELQEGAQKVKLEEMSRADYEKLVNKYKPVKPYEFVPKPASREDAVRALTADKRDLYGTPSGMLKAGHPVGLRLDIPAYSDHGVWVPAVHQQDAGFGAGERIGYENIAGVMNPTFGMSEKAALNIAAGKPKGTIATIKGNWNPMDEATAIARAQEYLDHPEWAQVGMDPERHGYFYDRRTMKPITAAEEAIQIGPLVLARKPQYGNKKDFKYADGGEVHMAKGGAIKEGVKGLLKGAQKILPRAEADANKAKFLAESKDPRRFYHGNQADINNFIPSRKGVFVSPDPEFASTFSEGATGRHGPNVMPVRVQVKNPFDYDNPAHMKAIREAAKKRYPGNRGIQYELDAIGGVDDSGGLHNNWASVEHPEVQRLIQQLEHDAYYTSERGTKNLGIYNPNQIKSDIGNRGTYDVTKGDINEAHGGAIHMAKGGKVEGVVKAGLKKLLGKADKAPKGVEPIIVRTPEERAVIDKFGQKQEQEAARQKKVEKAAKESAGKSPEETAKPSKSTGKRVAVPPDFYRKMAEEQGDEAVLDAARAGKHLKPSGRGFIGAPRTVKGKRGLNTMRSDIDQDFKDSVDAVRLADPERLGTWYDRAKQGIAESSEPYQLPRTLEQHGVYSAGVSPESELTFALKHLNSRVAGDPRMAYRGAGMENLDEAVAEGRPANMGFKIGEYANKNDPRIPNAGLFGVNDFRRAQGMGYTDAAGNPWHEGVRDTMHPFMDAETALQVDRANAAGTGGRTDWAGPQIQEVPWVYGKAQDQYGRGKGGGRYAGDELEGIKQSLVDANNTARDYMYKHAASATHEAIPGAGLNHVPQALDMTPEQKLAYGRQGRWDLPSPEAALNEFPEVGAGNRDILYGAAGYRQLPSREAEGLYVNSLGGVENNPMTIARPLMDFPTGGGGLMAPDSRATMDFVEHFRPFMDAQEAGAYNLANTMNAVQGKNSMLLDTRGISPDPLADPTAGVLPTAKQLGEINSALGEASGAAKKEAKELREKLPFGPPTKANVNKLQGLEDAASGYGVTSTNRGALVFPYNAEASSAGIKELMKRAGPDIENVFPGAKQERSLSTMGYQPGIGKRSPEGPLSTAPFSGEATADLLRHASELPQSVSENLSESEWVRNQIREKALRDAKMGGTRRDIQESRRFFSEADWPKAVAMIRKGMTPAAALAALGYNINAMAADER